MFDKKIWLQTIALKYMKNKLSIVDDGWRNGPAPKHSTKQPRHIQPTDSAKKTGSSVKLGSGLLD